LASLDVSLALPTGAIKRVLIYNHDLYCCKFDFEDSKTPRGELQVKEVLETSTASNLGIGDSLTLTSSYMIYWLMTPRRQLSSEGKLLGSITMRSHGHYITGRMIESYSDAFI